MNKKHTANIKRNINYKNAVASTAAALSVAFYIVYWYTPIGVALEFLFYILVPLPIVLLGQLYGFKTALTASIISSLTILITCGLVSFLGAIVFFYPTAAITTLALSGRISVELFCLIESIMTLIGISLSSLIAADTKGLKLLFSISSDNSIFPTPPVGALLVAVMIPVFHILIKLAYRWLKKFQLFKTNLKLIYSSEKKIYTVVIITITLGLIGTIQAKNFPYLLLTSFLTLSLGVGLSSLKIPTIYLLLALSFLYSKIFWIGVVVATFISLKATLST